MIGLIDEEVADDLVESISDRVVAIKVHLKWVQERMGKETERVGIVNSCVLL